VQTRWRDALHCLDYGFRHGRFFLVARADILLSRTHLSAGKGGDGPFGLTERSSAAQPEFSCAKTDEKTDEGRKVAAIMHAFSAGHHWQTPTVRTMERQRWQDRPG